MVSLAGSSTSIARRILLLVSVLLAVLVLSGITVVYLDNREVTSQNARQRVSAIAVAVADSPGLARELADGGSVAAQSAALEPYAEDIRVQTGADYVVVMRPDGTRLTHPNRALIGQLYAGSRAEALAGRTYLEVATGSLGPSTGAITPIRSRSGAIVGLVAVGITQAHLSDAVLDQVWLLIGLAVGALLLGGLGAWLIARWVGRQTLGLGPRELARMHLYHHAVLDSAHEGIVLLDETGRIVSVNAQAQRLLALDEAPTGLTAAGADWPASVATLVDGAEQVTDALALTDDRVLVISKRPAHSGGRVVGAIVTVRDHTDLQALAGELDRTRGFTQALRAQAHESANRLHTIVSLIELGEYEHARDFAVGDLAIAQSLADQVVDGIGDRAVAALLLGKSAQGAEQGIELGISGGRELPEGIADPRELVTIIGNLIDNAFEAAAAAPPPRLVDVLISRDGEDIVLTVSDTGAGMSADTAGQVFAHGFTTKAPGGSAGGRGLGLALVGQAVRRCGGTVAAEPGSSGRFTVRLPARAAATLPGAAPS